VNRTHSARNLSAVLLVLAVTAAAPALAIDSSLHDLPDAALVASPAEGARLDVSGVEVREIREIGTRGAAPAAGPADLWQRIRSGFAMPDLTGKLVVQRQAWYAQRPEQIQIIVERSRRYLFHIVEELERRRMPTELALLPMVESAFNPMAYSRAHASGLWQFIPSTGRNFNLEQNWWYDGRRDVMASTDAALDYLQSLYEQFGDWHLALAAYNMGENGLARAIERNRARGKRTDYESVAIPKETRYYVPSLQAFKNIIADPAAAGVQLDPIPNAPYFITVTLTRDIDLKVAAKLAEMSVEELVALNPAHNRPVVAAAVAPELVLPADRAEVFLQNLEGHVNPLSSWHVYTFKHGDRLDKIAAEHGVTVERLRAVNGLRAKANPVVGQQLLLPEKGSAAANEPLPPIFTPPAAAGGRVVQYQVKKGDTVSSIARALGAKLADVRAANGGDQLAIGKTLSISVTGSTARPTRSAAKKAKPAASKATAKTPAPAQTAPPPQVARRSSAS
jgi:membrane-bound lytic murein transglycosylase D